MYLVEYGFGALVALMTFRLSSGLVRVRAAERELEDREHSYREIFNATSEAIFVVDARSGAICDANDAVTQLLGYSREEALALGAGDLTTSTTASGQQLGLARFAEAGERGQARFEGVTRTRDGRDALGGGDAEGGIARWRAAHSSPSCAMCPDRKRAETALSETRHFSEQVVDAIPGIIYIFDLVAGRAVYSNRNVGDLLGYTPEEIAAMGESLLARIVMPEDLPTTMRLLGRWEAAGDEDVLTSEYRVRTRDGELRWWMGRDKVFSRSPDGRVAQIIGSVHDITDRRRAELALRESEERYRTLVEASPSGILLPRPRVQDRLRQPSRVPHLRACRTPPG
ncbi:MAG: PAS domain S-box protein [Thermoanaerobaculaceae bacterium]